MVSFSHRFRRWISHEAVVHSFLWLLYFVVLAYQKNRIGARYGEEVHLKWVDLIFALHYFWVILVINYYLLPRFFYRKRYGGFALMSVLTLGTAVLIEEFLLEPWLFPGSRRAENFMGFLPTLLETGPTILFFVGFKLAWDNLQQQNALEQVEKEKTESQLQFLKSQLNPHFLFNNLNNLYSYAQEQSPKTPEIVLQLSAMMRYMLYESQENWVPLEKELRYLSDFIRLQELQMEDRGQVDYSVQGAVWNKHIAPMVLLVFVENCFKHSLSSQPDDIRIKIKVEVYEHELRFECANTYAEQSSTASKHLSSGIGLKNVHKRLALQYPHQHDLDIYQQDGVFVVKLKLAF